jgi:hypothetical protein
MTTSSSSIPAYIQTMSTTANISNIEEGQAQTITDISELQNIEKYYFSQLNQGLINDSLTTEQKDSLVQKINEISQMRLNLYKNLYSNYNFYETNVSSTQTTMSEQMAAIDIVDAELDEAKERLRLLEEERNNKLRLVEINNYYGQKFVDQSRIMKIIIVICVPILFLSILVNRGIISMGIYSGLVILIIFVGVIVLFRHLYYTTMRDNMNYQEFDFTFDKSQAPAVDTTGSSNDTTGQASSSTSVCVGQACCAEGENYDSVYNKCVPITTN